MSDEPASLRIYESHRSALLKYAYGITGSQSLAEDVVQEAWLRLNAARGRKEVREPLRYLYRIVRNLSVDMLRRDDRSPVHSGVELEHAARVVAADAPSPEQVAIGREDMRRVSEALAELPERQRRAIEMYRIDGYKLREIAKHLGVSVSLAHHLIVEGLAHCDRRRTEGR